MHLHNAVWHPDLARTVNTKKTSFFLAALACVDKPLTGISIHLLSQVEPAHLLTREVNAMAS